MESKKLNAKEERLLEVEERPREMERIEDEDVEVENEERREEIEDEERRRRRERAAWRLLVRVEKKGIVAGILGGERDSVEEGGDGGCLGPGGDMGELSSPARETADYGMLRRVVRGWVGC